LRRGSTTRRVGSEPNGIVLAGGDAWVISYELSTLTRLSRATGVERSQHPRIGIGGNDIAVDGDAIWVARNQDRQIVRLDARSGAITRRLGTTGRPLYLAAGPSGVWFGTHQDAGPDRLVHYDRSGTRMLADREVPEGVGPMALGGGFLWFA